LTADADPSTLCSGGAMLRLHPLTCGWFQAPLSFFVGGNHDRMVRAPVPAYLIDHPKGLALFDTGLGVRFRREADATLGAREMGFDCDESADIAMRLKAIDVVPANIRWIINSHFHADHCGGNASIPNATVIVQSRELASAQAHADGLIYDPVDYDVGHPIMAIDGEHDLFGDGSVILFPTFGHTPGHQSARVALASGEVVLTADCCYLKQNLEEMLLPPHTHDIEASLGTLRHLAKLRNQGRKIFFGHDPDFWRSIPHDRPLS
jgi:glyoxylase-like metal-dependent hydrolase (beta-lactamase superfamily II)